MTLLPRRLVTGLVLSIALAGVASAGVVDSMWTRINAGYYRPDSNEVDLDAARVHYDSVTHSIYVVGRGDGDWDPHQTDMLLMRYDLNGRLLWAHRSVDEYQRRHGVPGLH